jgi:hypothetical protein
MLFQVPPASVFLAHDIKTYEEWGREVTIGLSVLVLVVLVATLIFQRRRLLEPTAKWLFLLGIVVLPTFISITGVFTVFRMGERAEFCGSCHPVMDPYSTIATKSQTLAAVMAQTVSSRKGTGYACHDDTGHGRLAPRRTG